jgi:hypothetical protein
LYFFTRSSSWRGTTYIVCVERLNGRGTVYIVCVDSLNDRLNKYRYNTGQDVIIQSIAKSIVTFPRTVVDVRWTICLSDARVNEMGGRDERKNEVEYTVYWSFSF